MRGQIHILIAEDDPGFQSVVHGLVDPILKVFPNSLVSKAATLSDVLRLANRSPHPDLILLDLVLDTTMEETLSHYDELEAIAPTVIVSGKNEDDIRAILKEKRAVIVTKSEVMKKPLLEAIALVWQTWGTNRSDEREERQRILESLKSIANAPS